MSSEFTLRTMVDYLALPELDIPTVPDDSTAGRICFVLAVDAYIALKSDCELHGLPAMEIPKVFRCALPTVLVEMDGASIFHRLPHSLAEWAFGLVGNQTRGEPFFPALVDFGIYRDEHYAKFL